MTTEQLTPSTIELQGLLASTFDLGYSFGLEKLLPMLNQIPEDIYYDMTAEELFNGRDIVFMYDHEVKRLTKADFIGAVNTAVKEYPDAIGGVFHGTYMPSEGLSLVLAAIFGWGRVLSDIGDRFSKFLKS